MNTGDPAVADGFDVTPAALSGAAGVFDVEADAIDELVATLSSRLDTLGPCWGDDEVGVRFGSAYQDAGFVVLDNLRALAIGATRIGAALRAVAHSYDEVDGCVLGRVTDAPIGSGDEDRPVP